MSDPFGMSGTEVLEQSLCNDASEDIDVVGTHLSVYGIAVAFRRSM